MAHHVLQTCVSGYILALKQRASVSVSLSLQVQHPYIRCDTFPFTGTRLLLHRSFIHNLYDGCSMIAQRKFKILRMTLHPRKE